MIRDTLVNNVMDPSSSAAKPKKHRSTYLLVSFHSITNKWLYFIFIGSLIVIVFPGKVRCLLQSLSHSSRWPRCPWTTNLLTENLMKRKRMNRLIPQQYYPCHLCAKKHKVQVQSSQTDIKKADNLRLSFNTEHRLGLNSSSFTTSYKRPFPKTATPGTLTSNLLAYRNTILTQLEKEYMPIHESVDTFYQMIQHFVEYTNSNQSPLTDKDRYECSRIINEVINAVLQEAFQSMPEKGNMSQAWENFNAGLQLLHNIYSSTSPNTVRIIVSSPYHLMSIYHIRTTFRTLNVLISKLDSKKKISMFDEGDQCYYEETDDKFSDSKLIQSCLLHCYRLLQRWITGYGVRLQETPVQSKNEIQERHVSILLNAFVIMGNMNMAHRIIALQERCIVAPPLSPVAYSIIVKGYGRLRDVSGIDAVLDHAQRNHVQPDIIMCNGIIDAYVNCGAVDKAFDLFTHLTAGNQTFTKMWKEMSILCRPNIRTYNTMLKGFVQTGNLPQSLLLFNDMKRIGFCDAISVNTLVSVAVRTGNFHVAESVLGNYTQSSHSYVRNNSMDQHPNVEAYTELIDGYGKAGKLSEAVQILQSMRSRGVNPNEITYTSLIGAFSRYRRIKQAQDMLLFMRNVDHIRPSVITYNAMICGLVASSSHSLNSPSKDDDYGDFSQRIDTAMEVYLQMQSCGVKPNAITVSSLIDALTRCQPSKFADAKQMFLSALKSKVIRPGDSRVGTSMIRAYGSVCDVEGCLATFQNMDKRDIVSFNILLDSLCRCGKIHKALFIFSQLSTKNISSDRITPDVITYSILIGELLRLGTIQAITNVRYLYKEMKSNRGIRPDGALIDVILSGVIRIGNASSDKNTMRFIREVMRDAKTLWTPTEYNHRVTSFNSIFLGTFSERWKENDRIDDIEDDPLFQKKKWNKIDSGFRLWGQSKEEDNYGESENDKDTPLILDNFLSVKKWNDFDSGFRII